MLQKAVFSDTFEALIPTFLSRRLNNPKNLKNCSEMAFLAFFHPLKSRFLPFMAQNLVLWIEASGSDPQISFFDNLWTVKNSIKHHHDAS